jgi:adenosylmethionine---8-amino-7-oxononanoate aminotransferase
VTVEAFEKLLRTQAHDIAALIVEPLVLGAAGMMMYGAETLSALHALCRHHGIVFIADEVMTGWGRTGTRFACEQASVAPDILCLSKGLTGGFLPMGATLAGEEIYQAFYSTDRARTFFHSSSFTGNPLACAAACASLEVWETEPVFERIRRIQQDLAAFAPRLQRRADVENVRQAGTILALDVRAAEVGYLSAVSPKLYRHFIVSGVLLRPIGQSIYVLPPYCISRADLESVVARVEIALDALAAGEL